MLLGSLKAKGLVIPLTPEGRGHVVTHALYTPRGMEHLKVQYSQGRAAAYSPDDGPLPPPAPLAARPAAAVAATGAPSSGVASGSAGGDALRRELEEIRGQLVQMRGELQDFSAQQQRLQEDVARPERRLGRVGKRWDFASLVPPYRCFRNRNHARIAHPTLPPLFGQDTSLMGRSWV